MIDVLDYSEIPSLDEILNYLPIEADDKEEISSYIQNILNVVSVNYRYEQYQFAYFGLHLLYMTYIYSAVWKISQITPDRYSDVVIFAKPYHNRKLDFNNIDSIFQYSLVPEKDLPKIFKIVKLDDKQIGKIVGLVYDRNEMAHATGKLEVLTEESFSVKANTINDSMRNIHRSMMPQIKKWFSDFLIGFCNGEFNDYTDINDIISEKIIGDFKLSVNEILVCNEMSIKGLKKENPDFKSKLDNFKNVFKEYCVNSGYLEE